MSTEHGITIMPLTRRIAFLGCALISACALMLALPMPAAAAGDDALIQQGKQVFETVAGVGCKACHGDFGEGKIGPANRGATEETIKAALANIEAMSFLRSQLSDEAIRQVAAYTSWMGQHKLVRILVKRGRFIPPVTQIYPGTPVQLVIQNTSTASNKIESDDIKAASLEVGPRDKASIVWTAPQQEGKLTISCKGCRSDGAATLEVTSKAKPYRPPALPIVAGSSQTVR